MNGQFPFAEPVRLLSNDTTVFRDYSVLSAGETVDVLIDLATLSEDLFETTNDAVAPAPLSAMKQAVGPYLNVLAYTVNGGLTCAIAESIDLPSAAPIWFPFPEFVLQPAQPFRVPGWRVVGHYARVRMTNTNVSGLSAVYWMVKMSTI